MSFALVAQQQARYAGKPDAKQNIIGRQRYLSVSSFE
jgi:hypothetical protein